MKKPVRAALPIFKNPSNENMEFLEQKKPILDQVQWRLIIMQITWGPGRNKVIISIYSIRVFFLKKGNLLWFSWFLHYLNSPSQTWSLGRSKMTLNLSCVFLKLLKYSKIEKKCYFWLQALAHAVLGIGLLAWLGNVSHRLTRIDKIVASWLTKINTYTYLTKARALDKALIKTNVNKRKLIKYLSLRSWTIIRLVRKIQRQFHPNFKNL